MNSNSVSKIKLYYNQTFESKIGLENWGMFQTTQQLIAKPRLEVQAPFCELTPEKFNFNILATKNFGENGLGPSISHSSKEEKIFVLNNKGEFSAYITNLKNLDQKVIRY